MVSADFSTPQTFQRPAAKSGKPLPVRPIFQLTERFPFMVSADFLTFQTFQNLYVDKSLWRLQVGSETVASQTDFAAHETISFYGKCRLFDPLNFPEAFSS